MKKHFQKTIKLKLNLNTLKIISDYGSLTGARGKKRKISHQGIDIHDLSGIPILAARDGSVLDYDEKCWGLTVAIDHGLILMEKNSTPFMGI